MKAWNQLCCLIYLSFGAHIVVPIFATRHCRDFSACFEFKHVYICVSHLHSFVTLIFAPMPPKKSPGASASAKHHAISLEDKVAMIKHHEKVEKVIAIAQSFGLSRTTVSMIVHDKDRVLAHVKSEAPGIKNTIINEKRGKIFEEKENLLSIWIDRQNRQRSTVSQESIQEKALSLFEDLKIKYPNEDVELKASEGWFMRFKEQKSYRSLKKQGESASAYERAAAEFPATLKKIIEENGFLPKQIFNVDETGLSWKKLPDRSFISKEEKTIPGYKVSKERLTLMLGGNCARYFKLKPLLEYHAHNPVPWRTYPRHLFSLYGWLIQERESLLLFLKIGSSIILSQQQRSIVRRKGFLLRFYLFWIKHLATWRTS